MPIRVYCVVSKTDPLGILSVADPLPFLSPLDDITGLSWKENVMAMRRSCRYGLMRVNDGFFGWFNDGLMTIDDG